jgi:hypothetical protein
MGAKLLATRTSGLEAALDPLQMLGTPQRHRYSPEFWWELLHLSLDPNKGIPYFTYTIHFLFSHVVEVLEQGGDLEVLALFQ